jgi:DNA-binding MarR family transcriptional regulator
MQQAAEELGLDITTFSRQAKSLEGKELIVGRVSPDNRRVSLLGLTPAGEKFMGRIDLYMVKRIEEIFSSMTAYEREILVRPVALLNGALTKAGCCGVQQNN